MTSSQTTSNGTTVDHRTDTQHKHGMHVLRRKETTGLIGLATNALYEATQLGYEAHGVIYHPDETSVCDSQVRQTVREVLACLRTAEHYLLMLDSVYVERENDRRASDPDDCPF